MTVFRMGNWEELGRLVQSARLAAGYEDTTKWAEKCGRSTRVMLGLERGEHTGAKTLALVENALGWPAGWTRRYLAGEVSGPPEATATPPSTGLAEDALLEVLGHTRRAVGDANRLLAELEEQLRARGGGSRPPHDARR